MAEPLTAEDLVYGLKNAGDPQISPDGEQIVYTLTTPDKESKKVKAHLWLCARDGSGAHQLTFGGEREGGARWSPDGSQIAFVSDRVAKPAKSGIFVLAVGQPGEARELTKHNQGVSDLAWSPDGKKLAYTTTFDPENPNEEEQKPDEPAKVRVTSRIDYKQDGRGYLNDLRSQIWVVDAESGQRRRVTSEPVDHNLPLWSPDGQTIACGLPRLNGMRGQLGLVDVATGATKRVGGEMGTVGVYSWSPSGDRVLYAGDTTQTHQQDFFVYTVSTGAIKRLTDDLPVMPVGGFPGMGSSTPVWLDERQVLFNGVREGGSGLYVIDAESGGLETQQTWQATHSGLSVDRSKRYIVQGEATFQSIGEITVYDSQSGESTVITHNNAEFLAEHPPAQWERHTVRRDPYDIEYWLLKPADFDPNKKYPFVLNIHGGPNGNYGYAYNPLQQELASNGFFVALANPRGSTSYGREFTMQVTLDWGGEDYQDLMAVVDQVLAENPAVDPERTGIAGYSYGGYMTSWIIGQTQRFKACVCGAPCFDLESMYGTSDISHQFGEDQWGGQPHQSREWYAAHSPSTFAHRATTPTLIVHGEADTRCPIGQGEQMFVALKKAGCEVEFARYPGGAHGFASMGPAPHREDYLARSMAWFKDHLGEPA